MFDKIKEILERAIDGQYDSKIWGLDPHSKAAYKLMMKFSGGIYLDVEDYKLADQKAWKKAFEKVDLLIKLIESGKSFEEISEYDSMIWYDIIAYVEGYLGVGGLTYNLKNSIDVEKNMDRAFYELNNIKTTLKKKRKLISFIHDNKYRYAFHVVFKEGI